MITPASRSAILAFALSIGAVSQVQAAPDVIVVYPKVQGPNIAATIQEGIDRVAAGGRVVVLPGTYNEAVVIDKAVTLTGVGGAGGVVLLPPAEPAAVINVTTTDEVVIRGLSLRFANANGVRGDGAVNITLERVTITVENGPLGASNQVAVVNNPPILGRARLVVRHSYLDGGVQFTSSPTPPFPQSFGVRVQGDVDARIERNIIRRSGGACIYVVPNPELAGELNAEIIGNDLDECYPLGRTSAVLVGPSASILPSETMPVTASGTVNIIGNRIRNSFQSCLPATAILYSVYTGRIERNQILNVVQECALPTSRMSAPAAIVLGDIRPRFPAVTPTVRYNDIVGNAHAGLRSGPNQSLQVDARCNYWGSATGPSGVGSGLGDAIEDDVGAVTPLFEPWATAPIAATSRTCD